MKKTVCLTWSVFAVFLLSLAFAPEVHAAYKYSSSPLYVNYFLGQERNRRVRGPITPYTYKGFVRVDYRRSGSWVFLDKVDMSTTVYGAGRFNTPLNMEANVSVQLYQSG